MGYKKIMAGGRYKDSSQIDMLCNKHEYMLDGLMISLLRT